MPKRRFIAPKVKRFCQLYVTGKYTQAEAFKRAGCCPRGKKVTLEQNANKTLKKGQVKAYLEKLQLEAAREATLTAAKVLGDIERLREQAEKKGKMHIALKASEIEGKYLGLFMEQQIPTVVNVHIKNP